MVTLTNKAAGPRGFHRGGRAVYLEAGQSRDVDLTDAEIAAARNSGHFEISGSASGSGESQGSELVAKHKGGGSYSVMRGDEEVAHGLTKEEAETFNAVSPDDQAAWLDDRAADE